MHFYRRYTGFLFVVFTSCSTPFSSQKLPIACFNIQSQYSKQIVSLSTFVYSCCLFALFDVGNLYFIILNFKSSTSELLSLLYLLLF